MSFQASLNQIGVEDLSTKIHISFLGGKDQQTIAAKSVFSVVAAGCVHVRHSVHSSSSPDKWGCQVTLLFSEDSSSWWVTFRSWV